MSPVTDSAPDATRALERDVFGAKRRFVAMEDAFEERGDRHRLALPRPAAAFEPRQIEQVADDVLQPFGLVADDLQIALPRRFVDRQVGHRHGLDVAADGGERRHQLVRHVGEQLLARLVRGGERTRTFFEPVRPSR